MKTDTGENMKLEKFRGVIPETMEKYLMNEEHCTLHTKEDFKQMMDRAIMKHCPTKVVG